MNTFIYVLLQRASRPPQSSWYPKNQDHWPQWLQTCCLNICSDEVIWVPHPMFCSIPCSSLTEPTGLCIMPSTWVSITFTNIWTLLGLMQGFCLWTHSRTAGKQAGLLQPEYVTGLQTFSQTGSSMGGWKVTCLAPWPWGSTRVCAFPFALLIIPKWLHL